MRILLATLATLLVAAPALAQPALKAALAPLSFLVGDWKGDAGKVANTGGTSVGTSHMTVESDGWSLLRRDRTELTGADGKPAGGFSQVMLIYAEAGGLRADYSDGEGHVIHYQQAKVRPGRSVVFMSPSDEGQPAYRLEYELKSPDTLAVTFGMLPQGSSTMHPIASGVLQRVK